MEIDPAAARKDDDHTRHPTFHTEPDTMDTSLDQPGYTGPSQRHSEHLKELVNDAESHHAHTSDRPQDRGTMDAAGPAGKLPSSSFTLLYHSCIDMRLWGSPHLQQTSSHPRPVITLRPSATGCQRCKNGSGDRRKDQQNAFVI